MEFRLPDGQPVATTGRRVMSADRLGRREFAHQAIPTLDTVGDAGLGSIRTIGGGAGFQLIEGVRVLFEMTLDGDQRAA